MLRKSAKLRAAFCSARCILRHRPSSFGHLQKGTVLAALVTEHVPDITHWNERLFSFRTTRSDAFRFRNGHFVMLGVEVDGKPLLRAYSIASANHDEHLEFFSIKVADGPLTSRLQHLQVGDPVWVSKKPVGTLVTDDLNPGKRLVLLSTGTGLAPFLSITRDPEVYERFEEIVLVHCVRKKNDLAYYDYFTNELPNDEYLGELISEKLTYLPTVTREPFEREGRITKLMRNGELALDPANDRVMLCGSQSMLHDVAAALDNLGFVASPSQGTAGDYVIERAFVEQ
ncbi:MAG: ferredoxin--NADP reductase [Proteobacteria bacterium]|nr:ferredoxin--NADP reductase [Pseudomonadota bacterium]